MNKQRYLMCPPLFFDVEYEINPWMRGNRGIVARETATTQWNALAHLISDRLAHSVDVLTPQPGLPDLVFTANAGLAYGTTVIPARFRHCERQGEVPHFVAWFAQHGWHLESLPADAGAFEGAGDALFDTADPALLWAAYGFRTDLAAHAHVSRMLDVEVASLKLVDRRFYHLDTCFCPLPGGRLLWYPPAFARESQALVEQRVPSGHRLAVSTEDALAFACNAVAVDAEHVVLHHASRALVDSLRAWGIRSHLTPLSEFLKSGGAAKCLTFCLN